LTVVLLLDWPVAALWQNSRCHWSRRARATKSAVAASGYLAHSGGIRKGTHANARLVWTFIPPDNRRRDVSNCIGALKAHIDGIAEAIGVDDSIILNSWPERFAPAQKGGAIKVEVTLI
jgi:crossover junction endodeoxyribonuclease RusA